MSGRVGIPVGRHSLVALVKMTVNHEKQVLTPVLIMNHIEMLVLSNSWFATRYVGVCSRLGGACRVLIQSYLKNKLYNQT